ncbi:MAG: SAM-dependent methyltransferase [Ruminococcaceae bacterium]|nr:SAM-dependent methyltransferase [Oscillospiraceae bacterium]
MMNLYDFIAQIIGTNPQKIIISNPASKSAEYKKIVAEQKTNNYLISKFTEKQAFHETVEVGEFAKRVFELTENQFRQLNAFSDNGEHILLISKKGACKYTHKKDAAPKASVTNQHNRQKQYILREGEIIPPLVDMGVFTSDGKIINSMYNKYRQINRFLEIIDDEISNSSITRLNCIDFGCGKSYLTFVLYYYLTEIRKIEVNMIGLDLKGDVIEKCNASAKKYGYKNLCFQLGDINGYKAPFDVDMVISLHACDTATDYALFNAINWNAKYIFSVPCCQHELNQQITPESLSILSRYGIIKERFSALATDAIRGNILEYCGYKTQILEFVDLDHTPKNILIRGVKRGSTPNEVRKKAISEVNNLCREFNFKPTLCQLLNINLEKEE